MRVVTLNLNNGLIMPNGEILTCPNCGESKLLTIRIVADLRDDQPVYVQCPWDHLWLELALPQGVVADFARMIAARLASEQPDAWAEIQRQWADGERAEVEVTIPSEDGA